MRTQINLSRRPFTNHRLLWIGLIAIYVISLWLLLWIGSERSRVLARQTEVKQQIDAQRAAYEEVLREEERRKQAEQKIVLTEQQSIELASARHLIQRKSFSWNRLIGDIEEYVPKNTRIMSIKVAEIAKAGEDVVAEIEVKALGKTPTEMTEMMANLEKSSGIFTVLDTGQEMMLDTGETPFTLSLIYKPARGAAQ